MGGPDEISARHGCDRKHWWWRRIGAPNFVGVFAPAGTPREVISQVARANLALLGDSDYRQLLVSGTFEPHGGLHPEAYRRYVESELVRWTPIVRAMGLKID